MMTEPVQLELFDIEELARREIAGKLWSGAPLAYTTDYYAPGELDAAWVRYQGEHGHAGCIPASHMWHRSMTGPGGWGLAPLVFGGHQLEIFNALADCDLVDHDHTEAPLPGALMSQAICGPCGWHVIARNENLVVVAWHDHATPGWRDLPVCPAGLKAEPLEVWLANYPAEWQRPGAPIRTERTVGSRHVPGRSPWGGYDIAATTERGDTNELAKASE